MTNGEPEAVPDGPEVDVIVVGAGPAGEVAAGRCASGGLSVAVVERELVGGECSYWACIPSKVLLRPGEALAQARRVPGAREVATGGPDVAAALARRDEMVAGYDDAGQVPWLTDQGVGLVRGHARLAGERRVVVGAADGSTTTLTARRGVVLATGSAATVLPITGLAEAQPWDNRDVTGLTSVPRRLAVLGGGPVGVEMAQAVKRLGAEEVSLIEAGPRLLGREEPFAGADLAAAFAEEGIRVHLSTRVEEARRAGAGAPVRIVARTDDGDRLDLEADEVLVAAGRRPRTEDLGLETVGLEPGAPVRVDDRLRARDVEGEWLYAVGDCTGTVLLTHVGKYQARIVADVLLGRGGVDRVSDAAVPRVVFTDPQVAAVGLTEDQARERGLTVRVVTVGTGSVAGASTHGLGARGTSALVIDTDREVVVGATFTGELVSELLHSATVAVSAAVPVRELWHAVPSFPTVSEVWLRLLETYGL